MSSITVQRFTQAANRLEVLRGITKASEKLFLRMLDRFGGFVIIDSVYGTRYDITDLGKNTDE